ncbi:MAG: 3-carboxy-cis,cis-muconate cycloisomerase, partial [Phyllobacterium sp.]
MAASVFDHPFLSGLFGDDEAASLFTAEADIQAMLAFETALAGAQADAGVIPAAAADAIAAACGGFEPDLAALRAATAKDGVVIPELVRQLRRAAGDAHGAFVHHGATSQDAIDTSLMLRLKPFAALLAARLEQLD